MAIGLFLFFATCQVLLSVFLYHLVEIHYVYAGYALFLVLIVSYGTTILINPGLPTRSNFMTLKIQKEICDPRGESKFIACTVCNVFVDQDIKVGHCLSCKICILGYDHHCGWSSKCIGNGNIVSFWVFFASAFTFIVYSLFCTFYFNMIK